MLTVLALRERPEDILPLAKHYLSFFGQRQGRTGLSFSTHCEEALVDYPRPGNLRELRNAVERSVILSPASILEPQDLSLEVPVYEIADVAASDRPDGARPVIPVLVKISL